MNSIKKENFPSNEYFLSDKELSFLPTIARRNFKHYLMLRFLFTFGITSTQLTGLKIKDINTVEKTIRISIPRSNSFKILTFPKPLFIQLNSTVDWKDTESYLFPGRNAVRMSSRSIGKFIQRLNQEFGCRLSISRIRNYSGKTLLESGWKPKEVQAFFGHKTSKTTKKLIRKMDFNQLPENKDLSVIGLF
jgi:integrase